MFVSSELLKPNVSFKSFFFQVNCTQWKCFFFFLPCSAPWVTSSLYLTIFSAETGTCGECFYVLGCREGGGGGRGRKQRDNSLKAVSVVGRLQKTGQHSEIKNRYTTLSCPLSNCALICSKKSTDVSDSTFPPLFFLSTVMTVWAALWKLSQGCFSSWSVNSSKILI